VSTMIMLTRHTERAELTSKL